MVFSVGRKADMPLAIIHVKTDADCAGRRAQGFSEVTPLFKTKRCIMAGPYDDDGDDNDDQEDGKK